uniref:DHHW family protein n=1 Tax=Agathobacter sp. TaxID=2021311 RepID=UPI0040569F26
MKQKVWILCGAWVVFALVNLAAPKKVYSEAENRYLEEKPELDVESVLDGSYMEHYESWMSDQLILRDELVALKASADQVTGRGDSGGVYIGKDGYLLEMFTEVNEKRLLENAGAVSVFLEEMEKQGIPGHFLMVATAACVLDDKLPQFAPELSQERIMEEFSGSIPGFINVVEELRRAAEADDGTWMKQLYYKTDHHWTSLGAYYAYVAFCEETGREAPPLSEYEMPLLNTEFYGTSYSKAGLYNLKPDVMTAAHRNVYSSVEVDYGTGELEKSLYDYSFLEKRDKYRVYLKGNYPLTKISSEVENGHKLLLIKDSYANTFVQYLTEDFQEIHVVDLRYFKDNLDTYVKAQGITEVLFLYQIKNFAEDTSISTVF